MIFIFQPYTCRSSLSSPTMAAFFQSITSEKGSSHPLLRMTGTHAACEKIKRKGTEVELLRNRGKKRRLSACVLPVGSRHGTRTVITSRSHQIAKRSSQLLRAVFLFCTLSLAGHLFVVPGYWSELVHFTVVLNCDLEGGKKTLLSIISPFRHLPHLQTWIQTDTSDAFNIVVIGNRSYTDD